MSNYSKLLKRPNWQKKRLEILNRDGFTCQLCGDTESALHVHHKMYSGNPWDIPNNQLTALCQQCHFITEHTKKLGQDLLKVKKRIVDDYTYYDCAVTVYSFEGMPYKSAQIYGKWPGLDIEYIIAISETSLVLHLEHIRNGRMD